jgi:hypothetical protein
MMDTNTTLQDLTESLSSLGWKIPRLFLVAHCLLAIVELRTVNLAKWAVHFDHDADVDSNYKRIQRFLRDSSWTVNSLRALWVTWLPEDGWELCLDRTNWMFGKTPINLLVLAVAYKGLAIPLFWIALPKQGNSNQAERIALMQMFIEYYDVERIKFLTADREFKGKIWLKWLFLMDVKVRIRIPNNTLIYNRFRNRMMPVTRLFNIQIGEVMTLNRPREIWGVSVWLSATRTGKEHVIVISDERTSHILADYRLRWSIETLFSALKIRGFNLEDTHLTKPDRVSRLLAVVVLAFVWCYRIGLWQSEQKSPRLCKHGYKAKSMFKQGLDWLQRVLFNRSAHIAFWDVAIRLFPIDRFDLPISISNVL